MPMYRLMLSGRPKRTKPLYAFESSDDERACDYGQSVVGRGRDIEVWQDDRFVALIKGRPIEASG